METVFVNKRGGKFIRDNKNGKLKIVFRGKRKIEANLIFLLLNN